MAAPAPTGGVPPPPTALPPVATPPTLLPPIAPPPTVVPPIVPPPAAVPPVVSPPPPPVIVPPPAAVPPVVPPPPPPVESPPPPVLVPPAPAPVIVPPPPPPIVIPPVVPPVVSPPPPPVAVAPTIPPVVSPPPPPPVAVPPTPVGTPPATSPPPPAPVNGPPPVESPPPPAGTPPPVESPPAPGVSPPPPRVLAPPPPGARTPPPGIALSPPPPAALGPTTSSSSSGVSNGAVAAIAAVGGVVALLALFAIIFFWKKKKRNRKNVLPYASGGGGGGGGAAGYGAAGVAAYKVGGVGDPQGYAGGGGSAVAGSYGGSIPLPPEGSSSVGNSKSWFTYEELRIATNGFANENVLGEGGFGRVYKGELPNGQVVAVKQLTLGGGQGDREFRAEVEIISRVHHRHLVSLVGYCIADKQRLLVYDFVPNGTLDVNLYGRGKPVMTWEMRVRVALGAARGLAYLHEDCHPRIIHRDIKSSNILLDDKYEAQVADFGLAKLASDTNTHVSTRVMGTFGYLAPEYAQSGKLTEKSDVYSFGVVLLELITGRKPIDQRNPVGQESLVEWTRPLINYALDDGNVEELIDPGLDGDYDATEALKILEVAASCVRHTASKRPKMGQVVRALESEDINNIHQGLRPGHGSEQESDFDTFEGDYDTQQYNADMMRSKKSAASSKPYGSSSEYTSEYTSGGGQYSSGLAGGGGSSSEFEPIIPKPGEPGIRARDAPVSVRTGRSSMPKIRATSTKSYTSLPPVRAAPPRPDLVTDESGSMTSDMFVPPPPPPNFSEEYAPIDFSAAKSLGDGR